jgi:predicted deacylase
MGLTAAVRVAYYISHVLMPLVDVVMDIHTGGSSMRIEPSSLAKVNPLNPRHKERMEAMLAFLTPLSFVWSIPAHGEKTVGILTDEAVAQGKVGWGAPPTFCAPRAAGC